MHAGAVRRTVAGARPGLPLLIVNAMPERLTGGPVGTEPRLRLALGTGRGKVLRAALKEGARLVRVETAAG